MGSRVVEGLDVKVCRVGGKPASGELRPGIRKRRLGLDGIAVGHESVVGGREVGRLGNQDLGDLEIGGTVAEARVNGLEPAGGGRDVAVGPQAHKGRLVVFLGQCYGDVVIGRSATELAGDRDQIVVGGVEIEDDAFKRLQVEVELQDLVELLVEINLETVDVLEVFLNGADSVDDLLDDVGRVVSEQFDSALVDKRQLRMGGTVLGDGRPERFLHPLERRIERDVLEVEQRVEVVAFEVERLRNDLREEVACRQISGRHRGVARLVVGAKEPADRAVADAGQGPLKFHRQIELVVALRIEVGGADRERREVLGVEPTTRGKHDPRLEIERSADDTDGQWADGEGEIKRIVVV